MKVLMAVDGSDESFQAIRQVGGLLAIGHDVAGLYVSAPGISPSSAPSNDPDVQARELLARAIVEEAAKRLPTGIPWKSMIDMNDPRRGIMLAAEQSLADLIVVVRARAGIGRATSPGKRITVGRPFGPDSGLGCAGWSGRSGRSPGAGGLS